MKPDLSDSSLTVGFLAGDASPHPARHRQTEIVMTLKKRSRIVFLSSPTE
jgi:hypothetical protein